MTYAALEETITDCLPEVKSANERAALGRLLDAASRAIDSKCKRPVNYFAPAAAQPSPRNFTGEGMNYLRLPVHIANSIDLETGVQVAGHPVKNWVEQGGWLYMTQGLGKLGGLWVRGVLYNVRARWGYEATPADIVLACKDLATHYFDKHRGVIGQTTPNGFVIERDMPPTVKTLIAPYVRKEFEVV
ncbi:MAG: phage gp6-like head-tail connector protein [Acidobacteria bacterium]|nr:phage gp6-like head-tail connector protein [Acidobacteriota bacterium]